MKRNQTVELTAYEEDRLVYGELLDQVRTSGVRLGHTVERIPTPEERAEQARQAEEQARKREAAEAAAALKAVQNEAKRNAPVLVFCTLCGKPHTGPRLEMAKFRKCCDTPLGDRKFCRGCGVVVTREEYFTKMHGNHKGWGTFAKCLPCGTLHRKPVKWCRVCETEHEVNGSSMHHE